MPLNFEWTLGLRFAVALAVGFLVGLERETGRRDGQKFFFGGVRTFPLISMLGFACGWFHGQGASWMLPAGLMAVTVLAGIAYVAKLKAGRLGATSEMGVLLVYVAGALACLSDVRLPIALGVIGTLLLSEKSRLEGYVAGLDRAEILATLKFLLVTVVIYPVLPDVELTPFRLNPARVWKIVVMVSAIGFVGYTLSRRVGARFGLPLSGLLGGIASSTAVSVATGRMARENPAQAPAALQASLLGSSVMYVRLVVLMAVFGGGFVAQLDARLLALGALGLLLALSVRGGATAREGTPPPAIVSANPVEIRVALLFAALFVGLRVATELAQQYGGQPGVMGLAGLAGLVDVDPFVLALPRGEAMGAMMIRAVLVAVMVNTMAKGVYFATLCREGRWGALGRYGFWALAHVPLIVW